MISKNQVLSHCELLKYQVIQDEIEHLCSKYILTYLGYTRPIYAFLLTNHKGNMHLLINRNRIAAYISSGNTASKISINENLEFIERKLIKGNKGAVLIKKSIKFTPNGIEKIEEKRLGFSGIKLGISDFEAYTPMRLLQYIQFLGPEAKLEEIADSSNELKIRKESTTSIGVSVELNGENITELYKNLNSNDMVNSIYDSFQDNSILKGQEGYDLITKLSIKENEENILNDCVESEKVIKRKKNSCK